MNRELQVIVDDGFESEIWSNIKHELLGEYTDVKISEYVRHFKHDTGFIPNKIKKIAIVASYDMGCNKRSIDRVYDSLSGHALLIGCRSENVISFGVCAKTCAKWSRAIRLDISPPNHVCTINHEGSSGSMKIKLALKLTVEFFD